MATTQSRTIGSRTMTFEAGDLARQADGSCVVTYGGTQIISTCTTANQIGRAHV